MDYNARLEEWGKYIKHIVGRVSKSFWWMTRQEIEQELMITLWRCHEKYPTFDKKHFKNTLSNSINNTLADLSRKYKQAGNLKFKNLETQTLPCGSFMNGRRLDTEVRVLDCVTRHETTDDFYDKGLKEIFDNLAPEDKYNAMMSVGKDGKVLNARTTKPIIRRIKEKMNK